MMYDSRLLDSLRSRWKKLDYMQLKHLELTNAACQVVKVEAEVKFNRAIKADLASLKLDIEHPLQHGRQLKNGLDRA